MAKLLNILHQRGATQAVTMIDDGNFDTRIVPENRERDIVRY